MADKARQATDKQLRKMERRIESIYKEAQDGITQQWNKYMENAEKRLSSLQNAYDKALKSGDSEKIKEARNALEKAQKNVTIRDQYYKDMVAETTARITEANQIALAYLNGQLPSVYAVNYNAIASQADKVGIAFNIVNENTVKNLITDGDIKLPRKKISIPKDMAWNTKQLNSSVLQGILQGESMNKIAGRIYPIVENNAAAAIRNARTMVTGAENRGRQDSYEDLEERGAVVKKVWIATPDSRTREAHLAMDGQEVDINEDFTDGDGNKIAYPGDPSAEPSTVYNCRCSMRTHIIGFGKADGRIERLTERSRDTLHKEQIKEEREDRKGD